MAEPPAIERRAAPAAGGQSSLRAETPPSTAEAAKFKDALVAPSVQQLVNSSIERLKQGAMSGVDARVEAVLRPMLKEWLDQHLPGLVEKLVRAEIERIVRAAEERAVD